MISNLKIDNETAEISGVELEGDVLLQLKGLIFEKTPITNLVIRDCKGEKCDFSFLNVFQNLEKLTIRNCNLRVKHLGSILKNLSENRPLLLIDLGGNHLGESEEDLEAIEKLLYETKVSSERLKLDSNPIVHLYKAQKKNFPVFEKNFGQIHWENKNSYSEFLSFIPDEIYKPSANSEQPERRPQYWYAEDSKTKKLFRLSEKFQKELIMILWNKNQGKFKMEGVEYTVEKISDFEGKMIGGDSSVSILKYF